GRRERHGEAEIRSGQSPGTHKGAGRGTHQGYRSALVTIPFQFDESAHVYRVDGMVIPGVTRVIDHAGLTSFENVRADILERRSKLGQIVHACTHFFDEGDLDWTTVAEEAKGYVDSWANLVTELSLKWQRIEYQCVAEVDGMKVGMRPDREGFVFGRLSVVDLKISRAAEPW